MKFQKWIQNEWKNIIFSNIKIGDVIRKLDNDVVLKDNNGNTTFEVYDIKTITDSGQPGLLYKPKTIFID